MKLKSNIILGLLLTACCAFTPAAESRVMCCPPKDKCGPKLDKCSPQTQCQPKDKCGACPDGLVETRKLWK